MTSEAPPYKPGDPRRTYHTVGTCVIEDYPRFDGSAWDLVAECLKESGRGKPVTHGGLTLASLGGE